MEDFRSKSCGDARMQLGVYGGETEARTASYGMHDLRCYSTSAAAPPQTLTQLGNEVKFKKGKSANGAVSKNWGFSDPELQRKKRIASYKVYSVEGKVKGGFRKSFKWLKDRCSQVVYGWR